MKELKDILINRTVFPGTCAATVFYGFGASYGSEESYTPEEIYAWLKAKIKDGHYYVAETTFKQNSANKALKKFGFKSSTWNRVGWSKARQRIWWYCQNCPNEGNEW